MSNTELRTSLEQFAANKKFKGKGPLCVALVVTNHASKMGLPLDPDELVTKGRGQVLGLGKGAVQTILKRHGVTRVLADEGGRTSRGSMKNMQDYAAFLNSLGNLGSEDFNKIEKFWIERVHAFFAGTPFRIKMDISRSLRSVVKDVIEQAMERQKKSPGMQYAGAVLQHLVGAKLDCALVDRKLEHNSFLTADSPTGRVGDFYIGDVAIHVTTAPSEGLMSRCHDNLNDGMRPIVVTSGKGVAVAEGLLENLGLADRIDVFEIEQFVALNIYELGKFEAVGRRTAVRDIVVRYNEIIREVETDPSLTIELKR